MISVVMPAYNGERYIEQAIRSVMNQTYKDWELLVIDDCSKDQTFDIVEQIAKEDDRIKFLRNERNIGVALTRNKGFDLCRGDTVALLDCDDVWLEDKLEKQLELLTSSDADLVYCSYRIVDEEGRKKCEDFIVPVKAEYEKSLTTSVISCSTVLMSRKIIDKYRFTPDFYHEDLVLWLQLLRDGYKAYGVTDVLAEYRVSQGARDYNKLRSMKNRFIVYHRYLNMSVVRSCRLVIRAATEGLIKYRRAG